MRGASEREWINPENPYILQIPVIHHIILVVHHILKINKFFLIKIAAPKEMKWILKIYAK